MELPGAPKLTPAHLIYEDPSAIAKIASWFLGLALVVGVVRLVLYTQSLSAPELAAGSADQLAALMSYEVRLAKLKWWSLGSVCFAGFAFLTWLSTVTKNAWILRGKLDFTPTSAVMWWFVPLANLYMPYLIAREQWRASDPRDDWHQGKTPNKLNTWWGCFVALAVLGWGIRGMARTATQYEVLAVIGEVCGLVSAVLAIWLVERITARQVALRAAQEAASALETG